MEKPKNYKENLLDAMKKSSEERKKEEAAHKFNGRGLFIAVVVIIAIVALAMIFSK